MNVFSGLLLLAVVLSAGYLLFGRSFQLDAQQSVTKLIAADLQAKGAYVKTAFKDHRFGDVADATEELISRASRSARRSEAMAPAYLLLATAQLAAGRDEAAEASFKAFLDRSSDQDAARKRVMLVRADAHLIAGRFSEAAPLYEAAAAEQEIPETFAGLAMCRIREGDVESAVRNLDRAVELGFDDQKAKSIRAQILADQGRTDEALVLARDATSADQPTADAAYTLVYALVAAQHPDAEAALRAYAESNSNDPDLPALLDRQAPDGATWREHLEKNRPQGTS